MLLISTLWSMINTSLQIYLPGLSLIYQLLSMLSLSSVGYYVGNVYSTYLSIMVDGISKAETRRLMAES